MSLRPLPHGNSDIEAVVLVETAGAGLEVERGEAGKAAVLELRPADMERVTGILAPEKAAAVGIGGKRKIEPARHEAPPRQRATARRFANEAAFSWQR
jgi:hypothetical protein